ncbi:MAG TPA: ATP-dependent DNA helicase RecG, partial [Candidatus Limnocylindrales bacterium]|nr:ATP-dependent DNA helicase RecG [Candidatus Limnocylindrales bacterium]
ASGSRPRPARRAAPPTDPAELLAAPLGESGLPAEATLRRAGRRLDLQTVRDLLFHLPRRYEDRREMHTIAELRDLPDGATASVRVIVRSIHVEQTWRRRVQVTKAVLSDATGDAEATWFGRRFIEKRVHAGQHLVVSGRLKQRGFSPIFDDPEFSPEDGTDPLHAGRIVPVYRLTAGLTAARIREAIRAALDRAGLHYAEYLPEPLRLEEGLEGIGRALDQVHYPASLEDRDAALRRLAFDELLALQLGMVGRRRQRGRTTSEPVVVDDQRDRAVRGAIETALAARIGRPIELTVDQSEAIRVIRSDLARPEPMLRLLQGDVGSGKTAVAAHALALVAGLGRQGALLAPTDLLARQHAATVGELLEPLGLGVTLLTGSLSADGRRKAVSAIASGQALVVVGTHALFQESVQFADLGLAVIDEQHRFGVEQRNLLEAKATARAGTADTGARPAPHVLLMTATPIPRTLGQVLYADLDVSDLRMAPTGRLPIRTATRTTAELDRLWRFVAEEASHDRRTFVVVPLIEAAEDDAATAAEEEAVRLRDLLGLPVGLVHGRLKPADRDAEMRRFRDGETRVLVGTTVIEVGVDVPEASVMVIEGAERFGLAQLHQLRGRVGRGTEQSYCVLVSDATAESDPVAWARLKAIETMNDGFELAEKDFELRGEGDVLGLVQSGLPQLRVASLQRLDHRELARRARVHAEALLDPQGELRGDALAALQHELTAGWLEPIWSGDPAGGA